MYTLKFAGTEPRCQPHASKIEPNETRDKC